MDQYHYLIQRYSKKTRYEVFLLVTGFAVIIFGSIAAFEFGETAAEKRARVQKEEGEYLRAVCKQGKKACDEVQEEMRKRNCEIFPEDCSSNPKQ